MFFLPRNKNNSSHHQATVTRMMDQLAPEVATRKKESKGTKESFIPAEDKDGDNPPGRIAHILALVLLAVIGFAIRMNYSIPNPL